MPKSKQLGFTLIELILVMTISSMLVVIAFAGQSSLRSQTQFDASVDKLVATIAQTRNEANAGVNLGGSGDGTTNVPGCATGGQKFNVFAGESWTADSSASPAAVFTVDYYVAQVDKATDPQGTLTGNACKVASLSRTISVSSGVQVNIANAVPAQRSARILFVRTSTGDLVACQAANLTVAVTPSFAAGACVAPLVSIPAPVSPGWWRITLSDTDGHKSQVLIDASGLARRQN